MNLQYLFEIQAGLDAHIEEEHPRHDGEDRLAKKILALQVELGELANEWRGFKFWSNDQEPRTTKKVLTPIPFGGKGEWENKNPLLEEYVDCLHFILSIGLELGITDVDVVEMGDYTEETTTKTFIAIHSDIIAIVDDLETDIFNKYAQSDYKTLFARFVGLGELQLDFTWEQIEQAYLEKNKINHDRQANGY